MLGIEPGFATFQARALPAVFSVPSQPPIVFFSLWRVFEFQVAYLWSECLVLTAPQLWWCISGQTRVCPESHLILPSSFKVLSPSSPAHTFSFLVQTLLGPADCALSARTVIPNRGLKHTFWEILGIMPKEHDFLNQLVHLALNWKFSPCTHQVTGAPVKDHGHHQSNTSYWHSTTHINSETPREKPDPREQDAWLCANIRPKLHDKKQISRELGPAAKWHKQTKLFLGNGVQYKLT